MNRALDLLLPALALGIVTTPFLVLNALGGRAAMVALTGEHIEALLLALPYFASWVLVVFAGPPVLVGCLAWLAVRSAP